MACSLQRTTFADPDITRKTKLSNSLTSFLGSCFAEASSSSSVRSAPSRTSNSNPGCIGKSGSSCSSNRSVRSCEDIPSTEPTEGSRRRVTGEVRGSIVMVIWVLYRNNSLFFCAVGRERNKVKFESVVSHENSGSQLLAPFLPPLNLVREQRVLQVLFRTFLRLCNSLSRMQIFLNPNQSTTSYIERKNLVFQYNCRSVNIE
jgi:hypothetical protein